MSDTFDPFDQPPSAPAVSFKDMPPGTSYTGIVSREADWVHSRDYETNELAYWDGETKQRPKMAAVINVNIGGEERSLWAVQPSAMFAAIHDAQQAIGARIAVGDRLTVTYTGDKPNEKNPRLNAIKQYSVVVVRADPFSAPPAEDPWAAAPPAPPAAPPAPPAYVAPAPSPAPPAPAPPAWAPSANGAVAAAAPSAVDVLSQIKALLALNIPDEQIRMILPQVTPQILAAVRNIPVGA